ncbi:hypothetical protein L2E82_39129 [Cichorium intybus]|uniref:Uncharacterized protein n=1 Tax=Cichorium intybus TaxID=13427 RepID=A0ACB9AJ36_CICIN|nr:hypothetical protein L2E82_39129 [Cichorium intybus]
MVTQNQERLQGDRYSTKHHHQGRRQAWYHRLSRTDFYKQFLLAISSHLPQGSYTQSLTHPSLLTESGDELQKFKQDQYIAKVLLAFVLLFVFGAIFTLALENLRKFLFSINSTI